MQLDPGEGVTVPNPVGGPVTFKVRGIETGEALTVLETEVAAGQGPPFQVHANEDETHADRVRAPVELRALATATFLRTRPTHGSARMSAPLAPACVEEVLQGRVPELRRLRPPVRPRQAWREGTGLTPTPPGRAAAHEVRP
jgi:hypothetical protein